jgi:uncharacterized integral membrane protein
MFLAKTVVFFIIVLLAVLFALSNAHHIPMRFGIGGPVNVKLIYLMLFSYLFGVLSSAYFFTMWRIKAHKRGAGVEEEDEEDEL